MRVAALIVHDGKIVLVRHRKGGRTYYLLPGGGVSRGETLSQALIREVAEETGLHVNVDRPLLISDTIAPDGSRHVINLTFHATATGGALTTAPQDPRVEAVELFEPERLSCIELRPPIATELLETLAEGSRFETAYLGSRFTAEGGPEPALHKTPDTPGDRKEEGRLRDAGVPDRPAGEKRT